MEAILGAAYLDGGLKAVMKIFKKLFLPLIDIASDDAWADNPRASSRPWPSGNGRPTPSTRSSA